MAVVGRIFLAAGTLLALFVAYLLFGTNLSESHNQNALASQFKAQEARARAAAAHGQSAATSVLPGYAIGVIRIPAIGLEKYVVEGTNDADLQKGPGHYPGTPLPGQPGNAAIAGHRTTYGAPFYNLNELKPGDPIYFTGPSGTVTTYDVFGSQVVSPSDVAIVAPTKDNQLTLTTCNPRFSATSRLAVFAHLVGNATPAAPASTAPAAPKGTSTGQSSAIPAIVLFGLICLAIWLLAWIASLRINWRFRGIAWAVGTPIFLFFLFFFFENLSRIMPAGY